VSGDTFYLIDHDLGFEIDATTTKTIMSMQLGGFGRYHIFFEALHNSWTKKQQHYFETFEEYLRLLSFQNIYEVCRQLASYGFSTRRHQILIDYFKNMKDSPHKLANLMRGAIG
jgi:hypothetical protein